MRSIALDVHRSFCEVAIKDGTKLRSGGRIKTSVAELELFAKSLAADDQVTLEASGPALAIKRILEPHVGAGGYRQHEEGARDRRGQGEDRQGRRRNALRAAARGLSALRFQPRRVDPLTAPAAAAPLATRALKDAG